MSEARSSTIRFIPLYLVVVCFIAGRRETLPGKWQGSDASTVRGYRHEQVL